MTESEFDNYVHESVHILIDMNRKYQDKFGISGYARWDYDMEKATLIFSNNGIPEVCAYIQIAGSIAHRSKSWLWAWNNSSLPQHVKTAVLAVKEFGEKHNVLKLTQACWEAEESDGWEMSAVANRIIGGKGVYRCPDEKGFLFLVLTEIQFVRDYV